MTATINKDPVVHDRLFVIDTDGRLLLCDHCHHCESWYVASNETAACSCCQAEDGRRIVDSAFYSSAASTTVAFKPRDTWKQLLLFEESDSSLTIPTDQERDMPQ